MATSFVDLDKNGFWIPDWLLQVWLLFLAREIDKLPMKDEATLALRNSWYLEGMHVCLGCMHTGLNEFVQDERHRDLLLKLTQNVTRSVEMNPKALTYTEINNMIMLVANELKNLDERWDDAQVERVRKNELFQKDVELSTLKRVAELFAELLEGKMQTTAESKINYWPWSKK